ncbi:MAG: type VI secretion system tube protein Hcp [Comamonadaceae bacterium]|nr:type VI secretion system tube protein Hcp [Comamonadaceae bacterium]
MRDKIGSFAAATEVEDFLNRWIRQYVVEDDNATQDTKAAYLLREASVQVAEIPGRAGAYRAVAFVRPHFQLDELSVSLRLVAELAARAAADPPPDPVPGATMKDIYVRFDGASELQGDSTDTRHANEIEVSVVPPSRLPAESATASSAGGHTAERTEHGEMLFRKLIDRATPKLLRAASAGTLYLKVLVTFYRAYGGKNATATSQSRIDYYRIVLEDVVVSSVETVVDDDELPAETFGLKYGKVTWEYKQHKLDGSATSTGIAGWDLRRNVAV